MKQQRQVQRFPFHWEVAIVFDDREGKKTFHGTTHDISVMGCAILTEHNVFTSEELLVEVHLPPENTGRQPKVLKIKAKMVYTLYSADHYCFRTGLLFRSYQENALALLEAKLHQHPKLMG